jgi:hypothetical protein
MLNACSKEAPRVRTFTYLINLTICARSLMRYPNGAMRRRYDKEVTSARRSRFTALHLSACTATLRSA